MVSLVTDFPELTAGCTVAAIIFSFLLLVRKSKKDDTSIPLNPASMLETLLALSRGEGPFFHVKMARKLGKDNFRMNTPLGNYLISDYKLARKILKDKTTEKPRKLYKNFQATGRKTMFTSGSDNYQRAIRKSTAHAFSRNEVGRMLSVSTKYLNEWADTTLREYSETGQTFDPAVEFNRITFKVICEAAFEYEGSEEEFRAFEHHSEVVYREFMVKSLFIPFRKWFGFLFPLVREARRSSDAMLEFCKHVLEAYRKKPNKSSHNTLIKILEKNTSFVDDDQRISEIKDWMVAGHDTTGYSLTNISTLLAKHPAVQTKLREELLKTKGDLSKCEYFQNVVKEGIRIMPVAASGGVRQIGRDYLLEDGTILRKNSMCIISEMAACRNEKVYKNADSFIPERWTNPTQEMIDSFSYIPFSVGPRACPGQSLAMAEINSILPKLLIKYSLELVEEGKPAFFLTLKYTGTKLRAKKLEMCD